MIVTALLRAMALAGAIGGAAAPSPACEVALALAIDVSGSVDPTEYRLQMDGLAEALTDPTVSDALVDASAAIIVIQWTGQARQSVVVPWRHIASRSDLGALSAEVAGAPRIWRHFSTGIGEALAFAAAQFGAVPECARRVIDVSGDGRSNEGLAPEEVRGGLIRLGFVINGLAIEGSEEDLTGYYRRNVIGGPGSFVLTAASFRDYPRAIRRKLLMEVTTPVTRAPGLRPLPVTGPAP